MLGRLVPRVARYLTARVPRYVARPLLMSVAGTGIYAITQSGMAACIMQVDPEQEPAKLRVLEEYGEDKPFKGLNDTTRKNLYNLLGFLGSRDDVVATARACLPHSYMDQFRSFKMEEHMRQKTLDGTRSVRDYDELRAVADAALLPFETLMRSLVRRAGLEPDSEAMHEGKPLPIDKSQNFRVLTIAPAKSRVRCDEKAAKEYDGEFDRIVDCVRCSVVVETEEQLLTVASFLRDHGLDPALLNKPPPREEGSFVLTRLKNRYTAPLFNGYRDGLYNISLAVNGKCWVVCEVQLHLAAVLSHKEESHRFYEYFRSYFSGNNDAVETRMMVLDKVHRAASPDELLRTALAGTDEAELKALDTLFDVGMLGDYTMLVQVRRRLLELASPDDEGAVATAKEDLGVALWQATRYDEAKPLLLDALTTRRRSLRQYLGNSVGGQMTEFEIEIEALQRTAASFREKRDAVQAKIIDAEQELQHEDVLKSKSTLAILCMKTRRKDVAEVLYKEVITGYRRILGEEHKIFSKEHEDLLNSLNNLAILFYGTGRKDEAEPLYKEVLAARRRIYGERHTLTVDTKNNLAALFMQTRREAEAEVLYKEVIEARRRLLGEEHEKTLKAKCQGDLLNSLNNLAILFYGTGRKDEAEPLYKEVLAARRRIYGERHTLTVDTKNNLAALFMQTRREAEAEVLYKEVIEARRRLLGEEHEKTLKAKWNLAVALGRHADRDEAVLLYKEVIEAQRRTLGEDHLNTLSTMTNLAELRAKQAEARKEWGKAATAYREAADMGARVLGDHHEEVKRWLATAKVFEAKEEGSPAVELI